MRRLADKKRYISALIGVSLFLAGCGSTSKIDKGLLPDVSKNSTAARVKAVKAFPGAQGYGAQTPGGRGGKVIKVTTLEDSGPGSLREALEAEGKRIVVFDVGGTIELDSQIIVENPFLTIAGQTAPGEGIQIIGNNLSIQTNDVIVRNLRVRAGSKAGSGVDALSIINGPRNVIIDSCSLSWGTDGTLDIGYDARNITVQWTIMNETLHDHSLSTLIAEDSQNISLHHNLFAHNHDRNPLFKSGTSGELVNNVIYNWRHAGTYFASDSDAGSCCANLIGNKYIKGEESKDAAPIKIKDDYPEELQIFLQGNTCGKQGKDWTLVEGSDKYKKSSYALEPSGIKAQSAQLAYESVLAKAGARYPARDEVDERIIEDVRNGTGKIISSEDEVGGYPELAEGEAAKDADNDGLPDSWERKHGLNPKDSKDSSSIAPSGYAWIEEYANSLIASK